MFSFQISWFSIFLIWIKLPLGVINSTVCEHQSDGRWRRNLTTPDSSWQLDWQVNINNHWHSWTSHKKRCKWFRFVSAVLSFFKNSFRYWKQTEVRMVMDKRCRLCMLTSSSEGSSFFDIFSDIGIEMKMIEIIGEHFKCEVSKRFWSTLKTNNLFRVNISKIFFFFFRKYRSVSSMHCRM